MPTTLRVCWANGTLVRIAPAIKLGSSGKYRSGLPSSFQLNVNVQPFAFPSEGACGGSGLVHFERTIGKHGVEEVRVMVFTAKKKYLSSPLTREARCQKSWHSIGISYPVR